MRQKPPTMAGSSPKSRSPCSSTTSVAMASTSSRVCGRLTLRASWTRAQTAARSSSLVDRCGVSLPAAARVRSSATATDLLLSHGPLPRACASSRPVMHRCTSGASPSAACRCRCHRSCRRRARPAGSAAGRRSCRAASARGTTRSTKPCSNRNSARWKPSGSSSAMVPAATRAPAKPMSAFGSAMLTSPSAANEAKTPPVVGSVITLMNGTPRVGQPAQRGARSWPAASATACLPACARRPRPRRRSAAGARPARTRRRA